jgi:hypothetical protein
LKKEQFMKNETSTMSYILRAFGILPLLAILAASFCPAHAAQLQVNSNIPFTCASVQGGNTANGTPVILYSCGDGPPQQWNYIDGQLQGIGTANGVTTCLEANGSTSGSKVVLSACNGGQNQQWYFQDNNVVVVEGNLCLDSSPGLGNQLVVNACTPATSQNWIVRGMEIQLNSDAPYVCFSVPMARRCCPTLVPKDQPNYGTLNRARLSALARTARRPSVWRPAGLLPEASWRYPPVLAGRSRSG